MNKFSSFLITPMSPIPPKPPDLSNNMDVSVDPQVAGSQDVVPRRGKRASEQENAQPPSKFSIRAPSDAIISVFVHPILKEGIKYTNKDEGPFLVHVSRVEPFPSTGSTLNPIKFGQVMLNSRVQDISRGGIKKVGRNRISVEFKSPTAANSFLSNPLLADNQYQAVIPTFNVTRMGIVRGVPSDLSLADFVKDAEVPSGCGDILKARRLNRKVFREGGVEWVPTGTVVLTFSGQILPHKIFYCFTAMSVETYKLPTIQCHNCCKFGHVADQCRSKPKCFKCSLDHFGKSCSTPESLALCLFCSGRHFATSQSCPEQTRQKSIKNTMSQENISYSQACERFPPVSRTYSDAARSNLAHNPPILSSSPSPIHSYRKTISIPRSTRRPLSQGYDRLAHQSIISERDPPPPSNGIALQPQGLPSSSFSQSSSSDNLLDVLLSLLINMFSKMNDFPLPPNVADKLSEFLNIIKIPSHPME